MSHTWDDAGVSESFESYDNRLEWLLSEERAAHWRTRITARTATAQPVAAGDAEPLDADRSRARLHVGGAQQLMESAPRAARGRRYP